jgi:hypothetical protein
LAKAFGQKQTAVHEALAVDPMTETNREMPLARNTGLRQFLSRKKKRFHRNDVILTAMNEKNWRGGAGGYMGHSFLLPFGQNEHSGIAKDSRRGTGAPQPRMKREHRSLAESNQSQLVVAQSVTRKFGIKKCIKNWARLIKPDPALGGISHGEAEPLAASGGPWAKLGRIWGHKHGAGQQIPPLLADCDQIVAVGAKPMQKNHELFRSLRYWQEARAVNRNRHAVHVPSLGRQWR